eukprot:TRINITY_DN205_c1_g2_i2.p1 TRINITY_DN205_c1_g2~~TRINITY_DN205_c1_g2_i2.p1  ORF type:complete len:933 (-),score=65.54 TRINITY_DN205_c1_g2_i2:2801-5524(-)
MEPKGESFKCPQISISLEDSTCKATQTDLVCNGIPITFPYPPYPSQVEYMSSVVTACESAQNAMLESPTGTGKTLSLLCASLGWLKHKRMSCPEMNYPRILYTSRTHAQLAQAVRELKKTIYRPTMCVLASRDHLCINPVAKQYKDTQLNITCVRLRKTNQCPYTKGSKEKLEKLKGKVIDLEEFAEQCKELGWCPFYAAREIIPMADLLFFPYNYVLDLMYHSMFRQIQYTNSVLIFDEAHNVQRVAEDAWSFDLSVEWLQKCLAEVEEVRKVKESISRGEGIYDNLSGEAKNVTMEELSFIEYPIRNFIKYLQRVKDVGKDGVTFEGKVFLDLFVKGTGYDPGKLQVEKVGIGLENGLCLTNFDTYMKMLGNCNEILASQNQGIWLTFWFQTLMLILNFMANEKQIKFTSPLTLFNQPGYTIEDYKLLLYDNCEDQNDPKQREKKKKGEYRSLEAFCFNPGLSFMVILTKKPRSIILTSGTLTPMDAIEQDLKVNFEIKLVQGHIVEDDQVFLQIVTRDHSKALFNFNYANRGNAQQLANLGKFLEDICTVTPGGVLIFFSSYSMLNQCYTAWRKDVISSIENLGKKVFQEESNSAKNLLVTKRYKECIAKNENGAVFFAVCRGKVSEGLDFAGSEARTTIVVGVPFPSSLSKRVVLKREYLDQHNEKLKINGHTWYTQEAMRTVNQCLGRTIRNKSDYGSLILIDHRYSSRWLKERLSFWITKNMKIVEDPAEGVLSLKAFFFNMKHKRKIKPIKQATKSETKAKPKRVHRKLTDGSENIVGKKSGKIDEFTDLMMLALGEHLFTELMVIFKNYREGKIKSVELVAEYTYNCFAEAMRKCSDCKKSYVKTAMRKSVCLIKKEDKATYERKLLELVLKEQAQEQTLFMYKFVIAFLYQGLKGQTM